MRKSMKKSMKTSIFLDLHELNKNFLPEKLIAIWDRSSIRSEAFSAFHFRCKHQFSKSIQNCDLEDL